MKPTKMLLLISALVLTSLSCSFINTIQKGQLYNRVFGSDDSSASPPEILAEEILEDALVWNCQASDLREFLGDTCENYPVDLRNLVLDVKSTGDTLYPFQILTNGSFKGMQISDRPLVQPLC